MLIQILPIQIPDIWEVVKFAAIKSDGIGENEQEVYSLNLLQDLLSGKKQCYVISQMDEISFVAILEFRFNSMTEKKFLFFNNVYSFNPNDLEVWQVILSDLHKLAENNDCDMIIGESNNYRMQEILVSLNVPCVNKRYAYDLRKEN